MDEKGQEKENFLKGVMYSDVLPPAGFNKGDYSSVGVVSSDDFVAVISAEKIDSGKIALLIKDPADDGPETIRLIVFIGSNPKRQAKYIMRIKAENESNRDRN